MTKKRAERETIEDLSKALATESKRRKDMEDARLRGWDQAFQAACGAIGTKAVMEERERCALVCEYLSRMYDRTHADDSRGARRCAKWVRAGTEWITAPDHQVEE